MSYCVNCGVELQETEKVCVLCGCEVVNPMKKADPEAVRPYPDTIDEMTKKANRRFTVLVASCLFALPALVCFFLNIFYFHEVLWSLYVIGGVAFLWTCSVVPLISPKFNMIVLLFFDFTAAALYLLLIEKMLLTDRWFLQLALPILGSIWLLLEILIFLYQKKKIRAFQVPATAFLMIGLLTAAIDIIVHFYLKNGLMISWSVFVMIPSFLFAFLFFFIEQKRSIKEELLKRLHF